MGNVQLDKGKEMNAERIKRLLAVLSLTVGLGSHSFISITVCADIVSENGSSRATGYVESNKIITHGDKTHVSWLDSYEDEFHVQIKTLDRTTGTWSETYTLGDTRDNHGGPALTVDSEGYLHTVSYPHHNPFRYRKSLNPNDASAWTEETLVGDDLTYPSLVTGPDDTLYLIARSSEGPSSEPWGVNLYTKPKDGDWSGPTEILQAGEPDYSHFQASLAWGPDHQTLHMATRMYGDDPRWGYEIGYMKSTDFGQTWRTSIGTSLSLPATKATVDVIESIDPSLRSSYGSASALRAGSIAVDSHNVPYVVYNTLGPDGSTPLQAWIATANGHGGWEKTSLNEKLDALPEGWGLGVPGGISFTEDGRMALVLTAYESGLSWGTPGTEVIGAVSDDGGATFTSKFISTIDPDTPNWMPSIERATGFNNLDSVAVLYTSGEKGSDNHEIISNQVIFQQLLGSSWNKVGGDVNQDGAFLGDGTGPAASDDVSAFIEHWNATNLPGLFGTHESVTHGDLNFDGVTDLHDVFLLRELMKQSGVPTTALESLGSAVPEPSSFILLAVGSVYCLLQRKKRASLGLASGEVYPK
ncbi:BNR-4 repeat-containing protein [Adhaeretor mobilis]|uniref:Uncharacterized protein n=1 Tax=Adhaeretor mobilis TaxID=1930276 RepID=A0A517MVA9_9BACT|nr:BNR-4 repeat-containing protein [Adhaeretor mobilis]QDS98821.1 hypothetical protein HG15A2_21060 [Adhaeretor mobilis]